MLVEIPYILLQTVVYGVIVYAMIGFEWNAAKFFWFLFFMFTTLLYYTFYGMMTVAVTPNPSVASIIASSFYGLWNLFAGFIVPRPVSSLVLMFLQFINYTIHMQYTIIVILEILYHFILFGKTENANMVEMVLLGKSCCMDIVWTLGFSVWRCQGCAGG